MEDDNMPEARTMMVGRYEAAIITAVLKERDRQEGPLGYTAEHDDSHGVTGMATLLAGYANTMATYAALAEGSGKPDHFETLEKKYVQVIALAFAGLESLNRQTGRFLETPGTRWGMPDDKTRPQN